LKRRRRARRTREEVNVLSMTEERLAHKVELAIISEDSNHVAR
jgi:hypothetical protein